PAARSRIALHSMSPADPHRALSPRLHSARYQTGRKLPPEPPPDSLSTEAAPQMSGSGSYTTDVSFPGEGKRLSTWRMDSRRARCLSLDLTTVHGASLASV